MLAQEFIKMLMIMREEVKANIIGNILPNINEGICFLSKCIDKKMVER